MRNRKLLRITIPILLIQRCTFETVSTRLGAISSHKYIIAKTPKKNPRRITTSWLMTSSLKFIIVDRKLKER
ncbi:MAG: hypothetical protein NG747_07280 [Candidatus Brocadia sp.]|nr:hypothetical protein [Candidatus Brocadia sp.]